VPARGKGFTTEDTEKDLTTEGTEKYPTAECKEIKKREDTEKNLL
jgi:hypothetical protein